MAKLLLVANVAQEHVNKFHIPTIKMLKEKGWAIDVACVNDATVPYCDHQYEMVYKRNTISWATVRGIGQLRGILKKGEYDIVHCHTPTGGVVARVAAIGLKRKPTIMYTAHGFHFYKGAPLLNWLVFYPMEYILSFLTDVLITINHEDYVLAKTKFHAKRNEIIHGIGVNLRKFSALPMEQKNQARCEIRSEFGIGEEEKVLVYVAELLDNKNQISLLDMVCDLLKKRNDVKLLLVGPDHCDGAVQMAAKQKMIEDHVIFTGWRNDVSSLIAASDMAVPSSKREGLGLNLIEAMAGGIPVVAYDNRGHREIIQDGVNGYIVPNGDHEAMARRVNEILNNQELYDQLVANARESIKKFDMQAVLDRLEKIYEEVNVVR